MRRAFIAALSAAVFAACASPAPAPPATSTSPGETSSPTTVRPAASPSPSSTPTTPPPATPTGTATPIPDLTLRPETLAQLRVAWSIDEPGNPNAQEGCADVSCWRLTRIGAYAFSPDGLQLAVGVCLGDPIENVTNPRHYRFRCDAGSEVRLYDAGTGELQTSFRVGGYPISLAFHPEGNVLAAGMADRQIEVWDLGAAKKVHQLDHSSTRDGVLSLRFSGDGTKLISEGDGRIQVWDWETPDGSTLVALYSGTVEFWDPAAETYLGKTNVTTQFANQDIGFDWSYAFTPAGYLVVEPWHGPQAEATPLPDPGVYCGFGLWDPRALGLYVHPMSSGDCYADDRQFASQDIYRVVVSPDGERLAADDGRGRLRIWAVDPTAPAFAAECLGACEESAIK